MKHQIIVPRIESGQVTTVAFVEVEENNLEIKTKGDILKAVKNAVTEWINETSIGEERWHESANDFNVGDLGLVYEEIAAQFYFYKYGINYIKVSVFDGDYANWNFDTVLVNRDSLKLKACDYSGCNEPVFDQSKFCETHYDDETN